jgi:hypothetical protein
MATKKYAVKNSVIEGEVWDGSESASNKLTDEHGSTVRVDYDGRPDPDNDDKMGITGLTVAGAGGAQRVSVGCFLGRDGNGNFVVLTPAQLERDYEEVK